jgi:hypothetical protein
MLQGNPFETELWIRERTGAVREGTFYRLPPWVNQIKFKVQEPQIEWMADLRLRMRAWWVPAAFGLGTLLGLAVG